MSDTSMLYLYGLESFVQTDPKKGKYCVEPYKMIVKYASKWENSYDYLMSSCMNIF